MPKKKGKGKGNEMFAGKGSSRKYLERRHAYEGLSKVQANKRYKDALKRKAAKRAKKK